MVSNVDRHAVPLLLLPLLLLPLNRLLMLLLHSNSGMVGVQDMVVDQAMVMVVVAAAGGFLGAGPEQVPGPQPIFAPGLGGQPMVVGEGGGVPPPAVAQQGPFDMGTLSLALKKLPEDNAVLLHAKREVDIQAKVIAHTNPMSKRSVKHDLRLLDCLHDLQSFIMVDGAAVEVTACNQVQVSQVLDMSQRIKDRIHANSDKHLVAKISPLGWKLVSGLEDLEGSLGRISMLDLRAQEMSYMKHLAAVEQDCTKYATARPTVEVRPDGS
jgi:hypothetical protein